MSKAAVSTGVWRDRTNLFISYRQSYAHHPTNVGAAARPRFRDDDSERAGLMANVDTGDAVIEMDVLPPRWLDVQDEIGAQLDEIAARMRRLDGLHARHVLPGFDDEAAKAGEERDIAALTADITRGFGACQRAIKRIDAMLRASGAAASEADATMARNLKIALAGRVGDASTLFRKKQSAYLKKMRALGGMPGATEAGGSGGGAANPYTDPALEDEATDRSSAQSTLQQTAQVRRRTGVLDATIATREREIESIAQGVIDLSNIFQELNSMVIDQGSLLDRVDYNVERTVEQVKEADRELTVATSYQRKSTKRKIILLLVLIVVGLIILLAVKPRRSENSPTAPADSPVSDESPPAQDGTRRGRSGHTPLGRASDAWASPDIVVREDSSTQWEWKQRRRRAVLHRPVVPVGEEQLSQ